MGRHSNGETADNDKQDWQTVDTLSAGVRVAAELPFMQWPTALWVLEVAKVFLQVALNGHLNDKAEKAEEIKSMLDKQQHLKRRLLATIVRSRHAADETETVGESAFEADDDAEAVDEHESFAEEIKSLTVGIASKVAKVVGIDTGAQEEIKEKIAKGVHTVQDYKDLFRAIKLPHVAEHFMTDETFAKYRIAGPNPMSIRGVSKTELVALIGDRITDAEFNAILKTTGDSVERAGLDGRLCVVNYQALSRTDPTVVPGATLITSPIGVFAEPVAGYDFIKPVAIQLGQDSVNSELVMANTDDKIRWLMAKTVLQTADGVYHELVAHLAHTHLVMETFSVATQRKLSHSHPLSRLIRPHIEGTNFINRQAATSLIAPDGPIDEIFANLSKPRLRSLQALAARERLGFDFAGHMPEAELKSRKVDGLKVFPYRDDVRDVWRAIANWAQDYVDLYYADDEAVKSDEQLSDWAADIVENGDMINFEEPKTKEALVRTLSMVMFVASAQHAAVNYPQASMMSFVPVMPAALWSDLPPAEAGPATMEQWLKLLPPLPQALEQLNITHLLGSVYHHKLGEYNSNVFPYHGTLERKASEALKAFNVELEALETVFRRRNKTRGHFEYEFLLPSNISPSINI